MVEGSNVAKSDQAAGLDPELRWVPGVVRAVSRCLTGYIESGKKEGARSRPRPTKAATAAVTLRDAT